MFFRTAIVALLASFVSAEEKMIATEGEIPASSDMGQSLLMKATVVEEARILNNNNDYSWMASYSIRYTGCTSLVQVAGQNGNNNKNNEGNLIYTQHLVTFSLCPVDYCNSKCEGGGHYVVNMADFVDLYTEAKMAAQELACENVREACYCDDANDDDACEYACYAAAGIADVCVQYEGEKQFEVQRYLECAELENNGNNNNNNNNYNYGNGNYYYGSYYVGPYCPDGKNIYMGLFYDQGCSAKADVAEFATRTGSELPYASKSIVTEGECTACKYVENNDNNNDGEEENYKIQELCSTTWYSAAHCEENMAITYPDSSACDYIKNILPRLAAASTSMNSSKSSSAQKNGKAATAFAYIFAFTTVLFAAYAYFLYRKIKRGVVALSAQGN